jgi:hypothetical protein
MGDSMSSIVVSGDTSGAITISAPAVAGTNTLTLPAVTGTVLTTASGSQSVPRAAMPAGSILQVISATTTTYTTANSTTYVDSTLTASITPTTSTSKILVMINQGIGTSGSGNVGSIKLVRNSTDVQTWGFGIFYTGSSDLYGYSSNTYLDSPATTSAITYKTQFNRTAGGGTTRVQYSDGNGSQVSTITLMEVAA